jgi:hypothetical protein
LPARLPTRLLAALLAAAGTVAQAPAAQAPPPAIPPTHVQIQAAVTALRQDANLGTPRTVRSLHWIDGKAGARAPPDAPPWIIGLFQFLSQATRGLLWVAGAIGLAIALVWIVRLLRLRRGTTRLVRAAPVSHIGGFDIRPDSLPDDVGAAALALLEAGRTREALSLLYRAALSRAVHRFGIRIEDSFTEGEALRAVAARLDLTRAQYFAELIAHWQRTVYGGRTDALEPLRALCLGFSPALDAGAP